MRFSRAGRTRGNLPIQNKNFFGFFFWDVWVHIERHRLCASGMSDPQFSTNSFTRVAILDPRAPMGPKGKRNRRGVLLSLLQCLRQTPWVPLHPLGLAHGFFRPNFIACAGALFHLLKRGEATLQAARLGSISSSSPPALWGATKHPW